MFVSIKGPKIMKSPDLNYILNRMLQQSTSPNSFAAAVRLVSAARTAAESDQKSIKQTADNNDTRKQ